jgi:AMP-binding enzyme
MTNLAVNLAATAHGHRPAVRLGDHVLSHAELDAAARGVAGDLRAGGIEPSDRVGLVLPKVPALPILCYGDPPRSRRAVARRARPPGRDQPIGRRTNIRPASGGNPAVFSLLSPLPVPLLLKLAVNGQFSHGAVARLCPQGGAA